MVHHLKAGKQMGKIEKMPPVYLALICEVGKKTHLSQPQESTDMRVLFQGFSGNHSVFYGSKNISVYIYFLLLRLKYI